MKEAAARELRPFRDPVLYFIFSLAGVACFLPQPVYHIAWFTLLLKAVAEEAAFRCILQETLNDTRLGRYQYMGFGLPNVAVSLIFAGIHFVHHPPAWAAAVFIPSLVFGRTWDRYKSLTAVSMVHFFYNFVLFHCPGVFSG